MDKQCRYANINLYIYINKYVHTYQLYVSLSLSPAHGINTIHRTHGGWMNFTFGMRYTQQKHNYPITLKKTCSPFEYNMISTKKNEKAL